MIELAQAPNSSSPKYLFVNTINILSFDLKVGTKEFFSPPGQSRLGTFTKSPPQSSACGGYYIDKLLTDGQSTLHKELTLIAELYLENIYIQLHAWLFKNFVL